ncbi:MAG TPA: 23S rRNA (guanosine(2251)-2'-O)-methyltransferase RlmB [Casimicrobiaceae bacterium]|nr:23S rRNA (guanosine(2251)-2'-O)-methyltransferase RlmB [Casimicrobiaceae bacterium]
MAAGNARERSRTRWLDSYLDLEVGKAAKPHEEDGVPLLIYGINPVLEALRAKRVTTIRVASRADDRLTQVMRLAEEHGVRVQRVSTDDLDRLSGGQRHQGIVGDVQDLASYSVEDLIIGAKAPALIVVLDSIEDPHNVGAILRSLDAAGGDGLVRQSRHAARLDGAAAKASAGAVSHVKIADVVNIARAIETLKDGGVWTVGLAGDASKRYDDIDLTVPTAIVVGAEGTGLRRLVRDRCDWLASIPMAGRVQSLNVSVAAGIALFEAVRQRARK